MAATGASMMDPQDLVSTLARSVDHAGSNAHQAIDRVSDAARPAVEHLATSAHHTVDSLTGAASRAAGKIDETSRQLRDVRLRYAECCGSYVRDKPLAALGIALGAGFVISWLLKGR